MLGGDHSLKFGLGYRKAPILTLLALRGGARARVQCVGNTLAGCGDGNIVAPGSASGIVAVLGDRSIAISCATTTGGATTATSRTATAAAGGASTAASATTGSSRSTSAAASRPTRSCPTCCRRSARTRRRPTRSNGREIQSFGNWSPRVSATYDLFGNGKTQVHAQRVVLLRHEDHAGQRARRASSPQTSLTWGNNQSSGACSTAATPRAGTTRTTTRWSRRNELIGTPTSSSARFNINDRRARAGRQHRRSEREDRADA